MADNRENNNPIAGGYTITDGEGEDVTANYDIKPVAGTLTINAVEFSVADMKPVTYNGDSQEVPPVVTFGGTTLTAGTDYTVSYSPDTTNVGTVTVTVTGTGNFKGIVEKTYQIGQKAVTITAASESFDYDGNDHSNATVTANTNGLVNGHTLNASATGVVRTVANNAANNNPIDEGYTITDAEENDVTANYAITPVAGTLTIDPIDVTVTIVGKNNTATYDSDEHSISGYTATANTALYDVENDFTFSGNATAKRTFVGTTMMNLAANQFTNTNANFATVTFKVEEDGYQAITPVDEVVVTITGHNNTTDYDGKEHSVADYDVEISNPLYTVNDFTFSGTAAAARTNAGTTNMGLAAGQFENKNDNFATVTFNVTDGYQTINPINATVTITGHNDTKDYDSAEHSVNGYDVAFSTPLYTEADFTFSGTAAAKRTDAGTTEMGLKKDQFANKNDNFATVTFNVTDGWQTINPIDVTVGIKGHSNTTDYDGAEHKVSGYDVTIENDLYKEADFTFSGNAETKRTDAGTTNMGLASSQFKNKNPNFKTVTFEVEDGFQTINPINATVTVVGANNTTDYDGNEHSVSGYTATANTALYDVENDFTFTGTANAARTDAGTTNMGLAEGQFANTNDNFATVTFEVTDGYQTINKIDATVTITGANESDKYDGEEHSVSGYTAEASTDLYDVENDFTFSGNASAARTDEGTTNMGLAVEQFTNTNENFANVTFNVTDGYQMITPVDEVVVTITGHNDTKNYDGEAHTVSGYDVKISDQLYTVNDFTFSGTAEASRTDAGTTKMGLAEDQFANTNSNFAKVTFMVTDGYQTIDPINVTVDIKGEQNATDYDGNEHSVSGYTATASSKLYDVDNDFTFSGTAEAKRTDAGTTDMGLAEDQFANTNDNFKTVTFNVTDGYQTINPIDAKVTITGHNDTADYDGAVHTVNGYDVTTSTTLYTEADFTFSGNAEAARTDAGTTNMGLADSQFENTNGNFKSVTFEVTDGYQTIDPIDVTVTITEHSEEVNYDGEVHTVTGYDVSIDNELYTEADFSFNGNANVSGTNAGTYTMELKPEDFSNHNANFKNVTFVIVDGSLVIKPIDVTVTITEHSDKVDYDGKDHTVSGYDFAASTGLYKATDFTFRGNDSVSGRNAGTYDMDLKAEDFSNNNRNFANVTFVIVDGQLVIDPIDATVTITGHNNTTDYNGAEHSVNGYDVEIDNPLYKEADFTFNGEASAKLTNAGTEYMGLAVEQFTNTNKNFANVTFNVTDGYQTVEPIDVTVTITGEKSAVPYDGEEHSVNGYKVEISNPLYTEDDFTFNGTDEAGRSDAGTTKMGLADNQFANTNGNFANVTFNVTDGYQTVEPIDVTVKIAGEKKTATYDNIEHSANGYTAEANTKLYDVSKDFTFSGTAEAKRTIVGTTKMNLAANQFANTNSNFAKVTFEVEDGFQTIVPEDTVVVTITGHKNSVDYDGGEHSVTGYDVEINNPLYTVNDFTFSGNAYAALTNAGTTNMGLAARQFTNTNSNFDKVTFKVTDGYQTINPINATVTITGHNDTKDYDSAEHSVNGYDVAFSTPLYTEADFTFSGTAAAKRTDAGTTEMGLKKDQFANKNDNFATVTFNVTDGWQTINPIDVTVGIKGHSNTTDYDGAEHKVSGYDVTIENDLYKEADFTFSGNAETKRTDAGTTNMGLASSQFKNTNRNFKTVTFEVEDGFQTVEPIDVTVTIVGANNTTDYDGDSHSVNGYTAKASTELYDVKNDITFSGAAGAMTKRSAPTASATRTEAGTTEMGLAPEQFANNNSNFRTVTFVVTDGYQTIDPIDVTVTVVGANDAVTFDGEEHSVSGYTATASTKLYDVNNDFTFNGNANAARTVEGTTNMGLAAQQFANANANFANVTFNVTDGYQTIVPVDEVVVTITGHNNTTDYDGDEHSVADYDVKISNPLYTVNDFTFSGTAAANRTDAGTTNMGLAEDQFTNTNSNFAKVTFNVTDGYQTVNPINVTVDITGQKNTTDYDGEAHGVSGYDVKISNPLYTVNDFTFSGTAAANRTDAGTTNMGLAEGQFENTNANFKTVAFNVTDGYQTINPIDATVTITGHSNTAEFDGTEHSVSGYDVATSTTLYTEADFTFNGTAAAARTDAGTTNMGLADSQFANTNGNFKSVTFNVTDGWQAIARKTVTVKADDLTKIFGEGENLTATVTGLVGEDTINYSLIREEGENAGTYTITASGNEVQGNYNVTFETGAVTINKVPEVHVKINAHGGNFTYDAQNHTITGYDVEIDNPLYTTDDILFSGKDTLTVRNAGTYNMGLSAADFTNLSNNFENVVFEVTNSSLVIAPKAATITVQNKNKTYGDADPMLTATVDGLAGTDAAIPMMSRAAGENVGSYTINATVAADPNYTFTIVPGTMTISPKTLTVKADAKVKTFGEDEPELSVTIDGLENGDTADLISYTVERESGEDVGTHTINVTGSEFQGNYNVVFENAEMTIVPEDTVVVRITAHNGTFQYDGTERDLSGYDVEINNELYSEGAFTFTGNSELKATNAGTYRTAMTAADFTNNDPNFTNVVFEVTNGELVITKRQVTLTSGDAEKTYDGKALKNSDITVGGDGFAEGEGLIYNVTGSITNPGTAENTFNWIPAEGTLAANYKFTATNGTLTVLPATTHTLTISYVTEGGRDVSTFKREYAVGEQYEVVTPVMSGFEADEGTITGIMGNADVNITVTYSPILYTLVIHYAAVGEDGEVAEPTVLYLAAGEEYRAVVAQIPGYEALLDVITGTMPASNRSITVPMIGEEAAKILGGGRPTMIIEDERTALGIDNAVLGSGEIIE